MRSKHSQTLLLLLLTLFSICLASGTSDTSAYAAPAAQARHGLSGNYYTPDDPTGRKFRGGVEFDEFGLPVPQKQPDAVRVDAQIAFGKDKGFRRQNGDQEVWWTPDGAVAVIWKGYLHLPKAGTYYLTTVSIGASAVYVNEARVALNGLDAGSLPSDAFSYDAAQLSYDLPPYTKLEPSGNPDSRTYVVPVSIDRPRDFPLEVRYTIGLSANRLRGIDLLWVTPDAKRDASGKPIAEMVPSDALYVDAPAPGETPVVRGANSTISADHLYPPADGLTFTTLTVRLADKHGQAVAGKHVRVSPLAGYYSLNYFDFVPADAPTDANGNTTFKVKTLSADDLTFFATDVDDLVDVAQVAHVTTVKSAVDDFMPDTFAPYYDDKYFLVEPLPLVKGSPATIRFPLKNHGKYPVELTATFAIHDWNIGAPVWQDVGQLEHIVIQPGETKEAVGTWTPQETTGHLCFKIEISGRYLTLNTQVNFHFTAFQFADDLTLSPPLSLLADQIIPAATRAQNIGPVLPCDPRFMELYVLTGHGVPSLCFGGPPGPTPAPASPERSQPSPSNQNPGGGGTPGRTTAAPSATAAASHATVDASKSSTPTTSMPPISRSALDASKREANDVANLYNACDKYVDYAEADYAQGNKAGYGAWLQQFLDCVQNQAAWAKTFKDPPDPAYRQLAIAAADTPAGYVDAVRVSMERYQAARDNGDEEWMARQLTALGLYWKRAAAAERRAADAEQSRAEQLPADDASRVAQLQAERNNLLARLRQSGVTTDDLKRLQSIGLTEEQARSYYAQLLTGGGAAALPGPRAALLDSAQLRRRIAVDAEAIAALSPAAGFENTTFAQSYIVGNPHDKAETVDLFIRPVSIAPNWKLSIIGLSEQADNQTATPAAGSSSPTVREVEPGAHYSVLLPAKGTLRVASVLTPVGEVGANTTARWAVEGKIDKELIGGMMHELNVPYAIPDLQLPPVGSVPQPSSAAGADAQPSATSVNWLLYGGASILVVLMLGLVAFVWVRRKRLAPKQ